MRCRPRSVRVNACAKLNLTLRVLGVRADGYHDLRTAFQTVALHDTLTFSETAGSFRLACNDPRCPVDETNLVWRAAQLMWKACGKKGSVAGLTARLVKRIPIESGLGGGSSDAVAALRGLQALWRMPSQRPDLRELARELGADAPFFLEGGSALGIDRGDTLFRLADLPGFPVVIVVPPFGVSTRDAYRWWDAARRGGGSPQTRGSMPGLPASELVNDLQPPVSRRHPEIECIARRLVRHGALFSAMSGSGSTVFGLFASRAEAQQAARQISTASTRVLVTRTLRRADYASVTRPKTY
jgi:4-diphosphocytidyl-2-C-methyl-D-erythritol kinase